MTRKQFINHYERCEHAADLVSKAWTYWHLGDTFRASICAKLALKLNPNVNTNDPFMMIVEAE